MGTVADIVAMDGENRALVTHGLRCLSQTSRPGLLSLMQSAGLNAEEVDTTSISFGLAPRLNAAGRTENALFSVELLLERDTSKARQLARQLEECNRDRRHIEQEILSEAMERIDEYSSDRVIVIDGDGWHPGVLGIVASRLQNTFYRPAIVIGMGEETGKGSGRSIHGFDLHQALTECGDYLVRFGGHPMAVGLTIEPGAVDDFRMALNAHARRVMDDQALRPVLTVDTAASADELTLETIGRLNELAPHGPTNPRPLIALDNLAMIDSPRVLKDRHLKLTLTSSSGQVLTVLGWGMASRLDQLPMSGGLLKIVGNPANQHWQGRTSIQIEMKDFKPPGD